MNNLLIYKFIYTLYVYFKYLTYSLLKHIYEFHVYQHIYFPFLFFFYDISLESQTISIWFVIEFYLARITKKI